MDNDFFGYLYVTGELDKDTSLANNDIRSLVNQYNMMFPNNPIDNEFFSKPQDEQIQLLCDAINNGEPIILHNK